MFPPFPLPLATMNEESVSAKGVRHKLLVEELGRLSPEAALASPKVPVAVVLDNVRSLYNVGSILRTADAAGIVEVCLCGITGRPPSAEIHKTALGAEDTVRWRYYASTLECLASLRRRGFRIWAVEQVVGSLKLGACALGSEPLALVFGHEVKGVAQAVVDAADACLELPQHGAKHSLNVSVAAGIALWEVCKHFRRLGARVAPD